MEEGKNSGTKTNRERRAGQNDGEKERNLIKKEMWTF